jgi:hypothetical protein
MKTRGGQDSLSVALHFGRGTCGKNAATLIERWYLHRGSPRGRIALASLSYASLSYASAAPVMMALAFLSAVFSTAWRISLERERQWFGSLISLRSCRIALSVASNIHHQHWLNPLRPFKNKPRTGGRKRQNPPYRRGCDVRPVRLYSCSS